MLEKYLIGSDDMQFVEAAFAVVSASSREEALDIYIDRVATHDETFRTYVYRREEGFWAKSRRFPGDSSLQERIDLFFGERRDYAALFSECFFDTDTYPESITREFPQEMLSYIWKNDEGWDSLSVFKISDIEV